MKKSTIIISFREEQGRIMHAAFYDHYTFRKISQYKSAITISPVISPEDTHDKLVKFATFIDNDTKLSLRLNNDYFVKAKPGLCVEPTEKGGLLVIPGQRRFPKPGEHADERSAHEIDLIKKAFLNGQPILAICGGSWKIWQMRGGEIAPVEGHVSPSMPTLLNNGDIGNNPQIHAITLSDHTILKACTRQDEISVNSVHWAASISNAEVTNYFEVSARSIEMNHLNSNTITTDSIEAFEARFGAPVLGIQWHPEAYYKRDYDSRLERNTHLSHRNIIRYMAQSGDAYQARRAMVREYKQLIEPTTNGVDVNAFRTKNLAYMAQKKYAGHMTMLLKLNTALFKQACNKHYENDRHTDPKLQQEYDKRFGLCVYKAIFNTR